MGFELVPAMGLPERDKIIFGHGGLLFDAQHRARGRRPALAAYPGPQDGFGS
jgi:hypothetical protein